MGKPQKSRPIAEVEISKEAAKVLKSASLQRIQCDLGIDIDVGNSQKPISPHDAASYVNEMAIELKGIAESAKLSFLAYLLDLVIEESAVQKRGRL
jgi:hypothetical protein